MCWQDCELMEELISWQLTSTFKDFPFTEKYLFFFLKDYDKLLKVGNQFFKKMETTGINSSSCLAVKLQNNVCPKCWLFCNYKITFKFSSF